jgi:hypothetical protein
MQKDRKLIFFIAGLLLVIFIIDLMQPKPIDWSQSYSGRDKIPYGAYGLYRILPGLFPLNTVTTSNDPAYDWLRRRNEDADQRSMLMYVNNILNFDRIETGQLFGFVENGGTVFLSAEQFSDEIGDSLGIRTRQGFMSNLGLRGINPFGDRAPDSVLVALNRDHFPAAGDGFLFPSFMVSSAFTRYDTLNTRVLGTAGNHQPNFIAVRRGAGEFFVHTAPATLTNYFLVDEGSSNYIMEVMSLLPDRDIYWDEYKKVRTTEASTPLRFILSIDALRYALYTGLFTLLLFIIFAARRRQAVIPLYSRPVNAKVAFVKTVTNLFFSRADHKDLAERKIIYLFDYFRNELGLDQTPGTPITPAAVAARSGVAEERIDELFGTIAAVREKSFIGIAELKKLNEQIEHFYQSTQR